MTTDIPDRFRQAGFEVSEADGPPETFKVSKSGCSQQITLTADRRWVPAGPPCFLVRGLEHRLEDKGYQKFWLRGEHRVPIRVAELRILHQFDEEVRSLLGLRSLYHESLGTTSSRSAYDRLTGRPQQV